MTMTDHRKEGQENSPKARSYREGRPTGPVPSIERRKTVKALVPPFFVRNGARLLETLAIFLCGAAILSLHRAELENSLGASFAPWLLAGMTGLFVLCAQAASLYKVGVLEHIYRGLGPMVLVWSALSGALAMALFLPLGANPVAMRWIVEWYALGLAGLIAARAVSQRVIQHLHEDKRLTRRVVIVGGGEEADRLLRKIEEAGRRDIEVCGFFDDRQDERSPAEMNGLPKLGTVNELVRFARSNRVDLLIVALPHAARARIDQLLSRLWVLPVDIRLALPQKNDPEESEGFSALGDLTLMNLYDRPMSVGDQMLKALEDRLVALFALILTAPVFLVIAAAIKLDSKGPVFFKQRRFGFNNELIEVYKFRSLKHETADANASKLVTADDDRVTRVGHFLRRSSLDELPQLLSVLKGDMSMVGPRPHAVLAKAAGDLYGDAVDGYFARHKVKPGMTGWAQINGWRGETDTQEKIAKRTEHDLYYIENWSLLFDLYIMFKTPWALLKGENAY